MRRVAFGKNITYLRKSVHTVNEYEDVGLLYPDHTITENQHVPFSAAGNLNGLSFSWWEI